MPEAYTIAIHFRTPLSKEHFQKISKNLGLEYGSMMVELHKNLTFLLTDSETNKAVKKKYKIRKIESQLKKKFYMKPVPGGKEICEKQLLNLVDKMEKIEVDHKEIDKFLPSVYEKLEWLSREELIKNFVSLEFNRFLDYYKDLEDLNAPEEKGSQRKSRKDRFEKRTGNRIAERGFTRFYINLGYKDSLTPRDLIGLINRCTRRRNIDIGRIDLMKTFSFFEVDQNYTFDILSGFKGIEYNQREVIVQVSQNDEHQKQEGRQIKKKNIPSEKYKRNGIKKM